MLSKDNTVTRHLSRVGVVLAITASVAVAPNTAAHAAGLSVTTADGRTLYVGDTVASGERNGEACVFPDGTELRLSGANTNAVMLTTDDACNLFVSKITDALNRPLPVSAGARPKYNEDTGAPIAQASGGGVGGVGGVSIGGTIPSTPTLPDADLSGVVDTVSGIVQEAKPKWQQEVYTVTISQPVYDVAGVRQYEDWMQVSYIEEWNDTEGRVRGMTPIDGACLGGIGGDVIGYDPVTTIRHCWYQTVQNGYKTVEARGGGWYRQGVRAAHVGVVNDERSMSETVTAWYLNWDYSCNLGGDLPIHWSSECWANRSS